MIETNIPLLLVQDTCFTITLMLATVLLMARYLQHTVSRSYETSRWLLVSALLLYAVHYLLQMRFGFRAKGEDIGTLINILFYTPIALLMVCATLRISLGLRYLKRFIIVGIIGTLSTIALFFIGLHTYGSLHMPMALHAMEVIYVMQLLFFIFHPAGELRRMHRRIEEETADDNSRYYLHMRSGTILIYIMGAIGALSIFNTRTVMAVASFFLIALIFYVVSFVSLGFSIQALSSIVDENENTQEDMEDYDEDATDQTPSTTRSRRLSAKQIAQIEDAINGWLAERGYNTPNLTCVTMAQQLDIPKRKLQQYLAEHKGETFRVWLSNIRIEQAKHMLLTKNGYSIESIAETCGFSSRSWMQEKFKASTGMSPAEWRETQQF